MSFIPNSIKRKVPIDSEWSDKAEGNKNAYKKSICSFSLHMLPLF